MNRVYKRICEELRGRRPRRTKVEVPRELIGDPPTTWKESTGWPNRDTIKQYRDGVFHIHETEAGTYRIHRDAVDPDLAPMKHLIFDMPYLVAAVAIMVVLSVAGAATALA